MQNTEEEEDQLAEEEKSQPREKKEKRSRSQLLLALSSITRTVTNLEHKLERYLPHFRKIVFLALFYAAVAFLYSSIGFLSPEVSHFHEYTSSKLIIEILGHFSFGVLASLPFWDLEISLLTGVAAVFIDTDHILSAIGFNVSGRPDHSFLFVFVSAVILYYVVQRSGRFSKNFLIKFTFFAPVVVFSHIAYDIFALPIGSSSSFQLFIPFSFAVVTLQYNYWILFETLALVLSFAGYLLAKRYGEVRSSKTNVDNFEAFTVVEGRKRRMEPQVGVPRSDGREARVS
jgi:hypothetical protein